MLTFRSGIKEELIKICKEALPQKAYGLLIGRNDNIVDEIIQLKTNTRLQEPAVNSFFESYGEFYYNKDRGFCISQDEQEKVFNEIKQKEKKLIAIYHSHRCKLCEPSQVDFDLHFDESVYVVIISLIKPEEPELKAFQKNRDGFREIEVIEKQ